MAVEDARTLSAETTTAFSVFARTRRLTTKTASGAHECSGFRPPDGCSAGRPGGYRPLVTLQDRAYKLVPLRHSPISRPPGDLLGASSTAGIRFTVNAGFIDLTPLLRTNGSGQFCGNSNFATIESSLSSMLHQFNSLNGANPADKVVGVVPGLRHHEAIDPDLLRRVPTRRNRLLGAARFDQWCCLHARAHARLGDRAVQS